MKLDSHAHAFLRYTFSDTIADQQTIVVDIVFVLSPNHYVETEMGLRDVIKFR